MTARLLAALALATIAFTAPAQAGPQTSFRHQVTQFDGDRVISAPWASDRVRTARHHGQPHSQRVAAPSSHRQAPDVAQALPEPRQAVAALPMGDVLLPDDLTGEFEGHADGLAYAPRPTDVDQARAYLIQTATIGGTMYRVGKEIYLAKLRDYAGSFNIFGVFKTALEAGTIGQVGLEQSVAALHPTFVLMAAQAIKTARANGVTVGLFSGYRPAGYGVGGFANKFESCHTYGVAGDFYGVGKNFKVWEAAATSAGLHRPHAAYRERNHWQAVPDKFCTGLRSTVTASGPKDLRQMWKAADPMIERGRVIQVAHQTHRHYRVAHR